MEQNNVNSFKVKARVIAFYLPQFHPTPENDKWWGKGFTEWTNVGKAKPLFKGHYQPRVPADLGYYDLRMPEIREAQAEMAREAGIEGFCYWHYWFGNGRQILESPFNEVLTSGKPDFPFCLGWANESWTNKSWEAGTHKVKETILLEQIYNKTDHEKHFMALLSAFRDKRYITVDGKPLFLIFKPLNIPDVTSFITLWQNMAKENGLKGIYFVGIRQNMDSFSNIISDFRNKNNLINSGREKYKEILD
ncbi:lipopolysaccharide biosynthesis protein, partial [Escherichia coli]|nr:lipopolysaccharide biosynthesis protein [Escherichia coli]